ncbi:MAG: DNA replication/repair protein RecF [Coprobacillaceae bacterium]
MRIDSLSLVHFRNYKKFSIDFNNDINIFIGKNAQGKTNIIEAIYVLSLSKSFRTNQNFQMVSFNEEFCKVQGNVFSNSRKKQLEIIISEEFKKAKIDSKDILKSSDYVGHLNVVVFIPDDLFLIKGSPSVRRKFIDLELSKISPIYVFHLQKYQHLLKERNLYLKKVQGKDMVDTLYLDVLDEQLSKLQVEIIQKREEFISILSLQVNTIYNSISSLKEIIELSYSCFIKRDVSYENILNLYKKNRKRDLRYGMTHIGIHKDDMIINMDTNEASLFASQGQQRTIVLAIKIALVEVIKDKIGEYPVLLLDDVLSELDDHRKTMLLNILDKKIQTFITTTSIDGISHNIIDNAKKIYIDKTNRG